MYFISHLWEARRHMSNAPDSVMTVKEVANYLRVNQRTVYRLAVDGRIPCFKVGASWRFKWGDIDEWIAAQSAAVPLGGEPDARLGHEKA